EMLDANGVLVPEATNMIHFAVSGQGINAGVDNGDPASSELFQADQRSVFQGRALLIVRGKRHAGDIMVSASSEGLQAARVTLKSL
ncbi:MAG: glycoside hydrolase family 2, partial [bacterium]